MLELNAKAFYMPNWCRDANPWHLRICGPHRINSASVDPTGSPPTTTHSLPSSQCSSSLPNKHSSPKLFTNHLNLSSLAPLHHSHHPLFPINLPHKLHLPSKFKTKFPPIWPNLNPPSIPYIKTSILHQIHTTHPSTLLLAETTSPSPSPPFLLLLHLFFCLLLEGEQYSKFGVVKA